MRACVCAEPPDCCRSRGGFYFAGVLCDPHSSFALIVNYLFRLLRVRMILYTCAVGNGTWQFAMHTHSKLPCSREHGQRWNDLPSESPYGRERTYSHGVLCQRPCGFAGADTVPYQTRGDLTRVKLPFYYYLEKIRKIGRSGIVNFL